MITLLLVTVVVGFLLFLFNRFLVPVEGTVKTLINYVVIFVLVLAWILFFLDVLGWYHFPLDRLKG